MKQVGPKMPSGMTNPMDALQIPQEEMIQLPPQPDRKYQIIWPIRTCYLSRFYCVRVFAYLFCWSWVEERWLIRGCTADAVNLYETATPAALYPQG